MKPLIITLMLLIPSEAVAEEVKSQPEQLAYITQLLEEQRQERRVGTVFAFVLFFSLGFVTALAINKPRKESVV